MCRLVYVIGMVSGGTSVTAGILTKNGFYNTVKGSSFESLDALFALWPHYARLDSGFRKPHRKPDRGTKYIAEAVFEKFKRRAVDAGYDKAVMKAPGYPIWVPEIFESDEVEPLLVWRDPEACAASIVRRHPSHEYDDAIHVAQEAQDEIVRLHDEYGWPMWVFGRDADVSALEGLLGVDLPIPHYDQSRVEH